MLISIPHKFMNVVLVVKNLATSQKISKRKVKLPFVSRQELDHVLDLFVGVPQLRFLDHLFERLHLQIPDSLLIQDLEALHELLKGLRKVISPLEDPKHVVLQVFVRDARAVFVLKDGCKRLCDDLSLRRESS